MSTPPTFGTPEAAAEHLAEIAGSVIAHASVVQTYADIGYWPGLAMATRCTAAYLRVMEAMLVEVERAHAVKMLRERTEDIGPGQGV